MLITLVKAVVRVTVVGAVVVAAYIGAVAMEVMIKWRRLWLWWGC